MENLNVLVTGGAGFIGSNIVQYLLESGVKSVRVLDNLSTGKMNNIQDLLNNHNNFEFMYGDISNLETCRRAVKDIDVIAISTASAIVNLEIKLAVAGAFIIPSPPPLDPNIPAALPLPDCNNIATTSKKHARK